MKTRCNKQASECEMWKHQKPSESKPIRFFSTFPPSKFYAHKCQIPKFCAFYPATLLTQRETALYIKMKFFFLVVVFLLEFFDFRSLLLQKNVVSTVWLCKNFFRSLAIYISSIWCGCRLVVSLPLIFFSSNTEWFFPLCIWFTACFLSNREKTEVHRASEWSKTAICYHYRNSVGSCIVYMCKQTLLWKVLS